MADDGNMVQRREPGPQKRDNVVSTGLDPDTYRDFETYRVEKELTSTSDAAHRLIRAGLKTERESGIYLPTRRALAVAGFLFVFASTTPPDPFGLATAAIGTGLLVIGIFLELFQIYKNHS